MKKIAFFAVALAAITFASCGGNKASQTEEQNDTVKSFAQEQIEANIKVQVDSLASEFSKLPALPMFSNTEDGKITLTEEEKQVKPEYLLSAAKAEDAVTLSEKYRILTALQIDMTIAEAYGLPTDEYKNACTKLAADINDPALQILNEDGTFASVSQKFYDAENENGRINYFWQIATTSIVEQLYVITQNIDKYITCINDDAASNITFRIALLQDCIDRLTEYDVELEPVAEALKPLSVLNAISQEQLKEQLISMKSDIEKSRNTLLR